MRDGGGHLIKHLTAEQVAEQQHPAQALQQGGDMAALQKAGAEFLGEQSGMPQNGLPIGLRAEIARQVAYSKLQHRFSSFRGAIIYGYYDITKWGKNQEE